MNAFDAGTHYLQEMATGSVLLRSRAWTGSEGGGRCYLCLFTSPFGSGATSNRTEEGKAPGTCVFIVHMHVQRLRREVLSLVCVCVFNHTLESINFFPPEWLHLKSTRVTG